MTRSLLRRRRRALAPVVAAALLALATPTASAHSLDSSTLSLHVSATSADATVTVATATLDEVLGVDASADEVVDYLADHLAATGSDGRTWGETWGEPVVGTVDGLESVSATVVLDPGGADPSSFTLAYDGVIEADASHEAVVVLTDAAGEVSTPGVLTAADDTLRLGDVPDVGVLDMVGLGFHHVLAGADHLLFLLVLLLVAPLGVAAGRWRRRDGALPAVRRVVHVVTAFTLGHSLTLVAAALGWVAVDARTVEVLVAVSVAVSALHAVRPLVRGGEVVVAGAFGLVHGLAFAGILGDLGLGGATSLLALLAFNLGVELAQLTVVALLVPSLYVASRTPVYPVLRVGTALLALVAATGWALDRLGVLAGPWSTALAGAEGAVVGHLWAVVGGLALVALAAAAGTRTTTRVRLSVAPPRLEPHRR